MSSANFDGVGQAQFVGPAGPGVLPVTTGKYVYVHHTGSSTSVGANFKVPVVTTIDAAIGKCRASKGDVVVVLPGHAETITSAGAIALDVAGVRVFGLGNGNNRPVVTISSTDNTGSITVSADNCGWFNVVVVGNDDALTNAFNITGNNFRGTIETQDTSSAIEMATAIRLDTADGADVVWKHVGFAAGDAMTAGVILDGCTNVNLKVDFKGKASTAVVDMQDAASKDVYVTGYMFNSGTTNNSKDVTDTITGSTWFANLEDGSAGYRVSGGSAAALASDDVSGVSSQVTAVAAQLNVPSADAVTNTNERDVIGNKTDASVYVPGTTNSLAAYAKGTANLQERVAKKTAATLTNGQTLFTVAGGPIQVIGLVSICETGNDATASTLQYNSAPTSGSAQTLSGASASLANATAGASVTLAGTALATAALYNANGANLIANPGTIVVPAGTITAVVGVGSTTGTWAHYLRYKPLAVGVTVS